MAKATWSPFVVRELKRLGSQIKHSGFFQALLTLERLLPEGKQLGQIGPPEEELVRLRSTARHEHPAADLEALDYDEERGLVTLTVTFLGLLGVDSPLPMAYTERVEQVDAEGEDGGRLRAFFDIFHQRLYSLLFRAWRKSRPLSGQGTDALLYDRLLASIGYSGKLNLGGYQLPALREARLKVLRARTAAGLEGMLHHRLGYRCDVHQVEMRRITIPEHQRTRLGQANSELGVSVLAGSRVVDRNKFRVAVRARDFDHWVRLLPEGEERAQLDKGINSYLRDPLDFDVTLSLGREDVPSWQLGNRGHRLGRTAWLGPPPRDFVKDWPGRQVRWA